MRGRGTCSEEDMGWKRPNFDSRAYVARMHRTLARAYMMQKKSVAAPNSVESAFAFETRDRENRCLLDLRR